MSIRNLEHLFNPESVAVFGASIRPHSVGKTVMDNLLSGGFPGPIMPVNPKYRAVAGVLAYPNVDSLPETPDLAVLCTPPATIAPLITELGERGTKAIIIMSAGLNQEDDNGRSYQQVALDRAKPNLVRILGPNCIGLMAPHAGLNASFAHTHPLPGNIAFVSQSGALATSVLDWSKASGIGFSYFVSLGNSADVDFGDVLDYLSRDSHTTAVLLYIESIKEPRKFMSAARAASRNKVIIAVKAGRFAEGAKAAASHTGALTGSDDVFDAALRRAGVLRVDTIEHLFDAVETLGRIKRIQRNHLTILTNGGGPGVMATDALISAGGELTDLSPETIAKLEAALPGNWSRANPVDIIGDAPAARYVQALETLLGAPETDAILFIHSPTAIVPSKEIAEAMVSKIQRSRRNILSCWLGRRGVAEARRIFTDADLPTYDTPEDAVGAFMQMVNYRRNQEMLMETPASIPEDFRPQTDSARLVIEMAMAGGREWLTEPEAKLVLSAYDIPTVETRVAKTPGECKRIAAEMGGAVALKIMSPDITHKSDVGGVVLDLEKPEAVREAAEAMLQRIDQLYPDAELSGFTVQAMARRPRAHELIVGASTDLVFGPVILFGQGGTAVEVIGDRAVALPPLNMNLARLLIEQTRVSKLLAGYRDRAQVDMEALQLTLVKVSQMITDIPQIVELDINPLFADEHGVLALDARMLVRPAQQSGASRLAIRSYPKELEEIVSFDEGDILIRPIRPEDEPQHDEFFQQLHPEDVRMRFFGYKSTMPHAELARLTQIDFDREMAFIASRRSEGGKPETLAVARGISDPDNIEAEFAIIVRSDLKGKGLGTTLMKKLIRYFRERGTQTLVGETLPENEHMITLAKKLGFEASTASDGETVELRLALNS